MRPSNTNFSAWARRAARSPSLPSMVPSCCWRHSRRPCRSSESRSRSRGAPVGSSPANALPAAAVVSPASPKVYTDPQPDWEEIRDPSWVVRESASERASRVERGLLGICAYWAGDYRTYEWYECVLLRRSGSGELLRDGRRRQWYRCRFLKCDLVRRLPVSTSNVAATIHAFLAPSLVTASATTPPPTD